MKLFLRADHARSFPGDFLIAKPLKMPNMINDLYHQVKEHPTYNKLVGNDYLIAEYKCPVETERFHLMSEMNFIFYVVTGKKDWLASGKTYYCREGDALFLRKGAYTTIQHHEVDNCVLLFFMNDDFIRNFMMENHSLSFLSSETHIQDQIMKLDMNEPLRSLFHSVLHYLKMGQPIPRNLVEIKFKELLFNIVLNPKNEKLAGFFSSLNQTHKTNLDEVMIKNFQHDLQLEEFARLSGRSLSSFKRDFQNLYRQSPGKWLTDKRLEHAKNLLLHSDLNANEIGYESGFRNSTHFNKIFKEKYHLPPKQFRERSKSSQRELLHA
jgi:AraC-like DNA-binding protein